MSDTRLRILSDLHCEAGPVAIRDDVECDVVVLAGDIDNGVRGLHFAREVFDRPIIYVPGNHEFYHHDVNEMTALMQETAQRLGIHLLVNDEVEINGRRFIGSTLWAGLPHGQPAHDRTAHAWETSLNDFRLIYSDGKRITPEQMSEWHAASFQFLYQAIDWASPAVVITHFPPTGLTRNQRFPIDERSPYFYSNLESFFGQGAPLWIYGHNHHRSDQMIMGTYLASNQLGYPGEMTDFDALRTVDFFD